MRTFLGYRRPDGQVGIRNHVLVIPANGYASTVAERIARLVPGVIAITHPHGAAQLGEDTRLTEYTLAGAAANPNVGAALLVGLDGEQGEARAGPHAGGGTLARQAVRGHCDPRRGRLDQGDPPRLRHRQGPAWPRRGRRAERGAGW